MFACCHFGAQALLHTKMAADADIHVIICKGLRYKAIVQTHLFFLLRILLLC